MCIYESNAARRVQLRVPVPVRAAAAEERSSVSERRDATRHSTRKQLNSSGQSAVACDYQRWERSNERHYEMHWTAQRCTVQSRWTRVESHRIATDPRPRQCRPVESSCSCTAHVMLTRMRTVLYCVGAPAPRAPASTTRVAARQSSATQLRVGQCCPIGTARHSAAQRDANGSTGREGQMGTGTGGGEGRGRRERERRAVLSGVSSGQRKHLCCS